MADYEVRLQMYQLNPLLLKKSRDLPSEVITHVRPEDLEQGELEAYAEEYAAIEDFEDVKSNGGRVTLKMRDTLLIMMLTCYEQVCFPLALRCEVERTFAPLDLVSRTLVLHSLAFGICIAFKAVIPDPQLTINIGFSQKIYCDLEAFDI